MLAVLFILLPIILRRELSFSSVVSPVNSDGFILLLSVCSIPRNSLEDPDRIIAHDEILVGQVQPYSERGS